MFGLALRSLRYRTGGFVASFIALFLGATIVMAFASMLDTGTGAGVDSASEETLVTVATIVGGWGLIIVGFAVASTLALAVSQRRAELALLKSVGATPAQVSRMLVGETVVVSIVAGLAAIPPAALGGRLLLEVLAATDQVAADVAYRFGPIAIGMGFGITVVAATIAAVVTARRATRMRATEAMVAAAIEQPRLSKKRIVAGSFFLAAGTSCGVVTATVMRDKGIDAMQTAGQAAIWFAIGLALFAPVLIRAATTVVAGPLERLAGASGYLTVLNLRQRTTQLAGALIPIILFTGIATATISMQSIENAATAAAGGVKTNEAKNIETLNFVVVGMIALFAAIMLINTLIAATAYRRREFGQQRLVGMTPPQVLRLVGLESLVLAGTGALFGAVASVVTVVPYSIARTGSVLPDSGIAIYLGIVGVAATVTLASSLGAARRAIRVPAVEAVAV